MQFSQAYAKGAEITLVPASGFGGDTVTVEGIKFGIGKIVTITYDGAPLTTSPSTVTTDAQGTFSCTFVVPGSTKGTHKVVATDSDGKTDSADFTVTDVGNVSGASLTYVTGSHSSYYEATNLKSTKNGAYTGSVAIYDDGSFIYIWVGVWAKPLPSLGRT